MDEGEEGKRRRETTKWTYWIPAAFSLLSLFLLCFFGGDYGGTEEEVFFGSSLSEQGVVRAASLQAVAGLLEVGDSVEVDEGCGHDQDMEDLVGMEL